MTLDRELEKLRELTEQAKKSLLELSNRLDKNLARSEKAGRDTTEILEAVLYAATIQCALEETVKYDS